MILGGRTNFLSVLLDAALPPLTLPLSVSKPESADGWRGGDRDDMLSDLRMPPLDGGIIMDDDETEDENEADRSVVVVLMGRRDPGPCELLLRPWAWDRPGPWPWPCGRSPTVDPGLLMVTAVQCAEDSEPRRSTVEYGMFCAAEDTRVDTVDGIEPWGRGENGFLEGGDEADLVFVG